MLKMLKREQKEKEKKKLILNKKKRCKVISFRPGIGRNTR